MGTNPERTFDLSQFDAKPAVDEHGSELLERWFIDLLRMQVIYLALFYTLFSLEKLRLAGQIASIEMENFMCHAHLKVDFDIERANLVFIGGPNGSMFCPKI